MCRLRKVRGRFGSWNSKLFRGFEFGVWSFWSFFLLCAVCSSATEYYVSPSGADSNPGTSNQPLATPQKAISAMASGDTIYVRGGTYFCASEVKASKSGAISNYCKLWAYPGEKPVFDFTHNAAGLRGIY